MPIIVALVAIALLVYIAASVVGGVLNITLGQLIWWAVIFALGFAAGGAKNWWEELQRRRELQRMQPGPVIDVTAERIGEPKGKRRK